MMAIVGDIVRTDKLDEAVQQARQSVHAPSGLSAELFLRLDRGGSPRRARHFGADKRSKASSPEFPAGATLRCATCTSVFRAGVKKRENENMGRCDDNRS
jgi:hypothetical protein